MVLKRLKLPKVFNGVTRTFPKRKHMWMLEEGQEFENFSKKGCFLDFAW